MITTPLAQLAEPAGQSQRRLAQGGTRLSIEPIEIELAGECVEHGIQF